MVPDKTKIFIILKLLFVISYIVYAVLMGSRNSLEQAKINIAKKGFIFGGECLSILGGSNAKWGISAEQLSTIDCEAKNYGVDNEGGTFENYFEWFSKNSHSKFMIYSSIIFLTDKVDYQDINQFSIFPRVAMLSELKKLLLPSPIVNEDYNSFGDFLNYDCNSPIRTFKFDSKDFVKNNKSVAIEVASRLKVIAEIGGAREIFIRIPPVYVNESSLKSYELLMKDRIKIFREFGINVIDTSVANSDASLFCDFAHHPNAKGRYFFTNELKENLNIR